MTTPWSALPGTWPPNYILLRTLEKRLQIARENVVVQKKGLKIATARWKGGTTSLRDVEQAKTVLDRHRGHHPHPGEPRSADQKLPLRLLMGLPPTGPAGPVLGAKSAIPVPRRPRWPSASRHGSPAAAAGHPERRMAGRGAMRPDRRVQGRFLPGFFPHRQLRLFGHPDGHHGPGLVVRWHKPRLAPSGPPSSGISSITAAS